MEQLAVQIPHSKQFLSFSGSNSLFSDAAVRTVVLCSNLARPLKILAVSEDIRVYKRKGPKTYDWFLTGELYL